ncbi:MAG: alpha/beta fold hydrolase [Sandaracinaceae bacterium]
MTRPLSFALLFVLLLAGCFALSGCDGGTSPDDAGPTPGDAASPSDAGPSEDAGPVFPETLGPDERPAAYFLPSAHDGETPLPVIILLHGYGASGDAQSTYFRLERLARTEGFYLITPDGTVDSGGRRFWNATPACCDFASTGVDDVAYLTGLLDQLESLVPVSDVYFMGHSNGGFMSYRMACELSDRISGIVSLAGSDYLEPDACVPENPVAVLQIHGDMDPTIAYDGGSIGEGYPSAPEVVERWATRNGCDTAMAASGEDLDLDSSVDGAETTVTTYESGCSANAGLWTIVGGGHIPPVTSDFTPAVLAWMRAQAR